MSVLTGPDWPAALRDEWSSLAKETPCATPFQTWEWQTTWWRHFGGRLSPRIVAIREGRDLVGVMPLTASRGLWRTLRAMGAGLSDYLQPLARDEHEPAVGELVAQAIGEMRDLDVISLCDIPSRSHLAAHIPATATRLGGSCLALDLPRSYETWFAGLGRSLRRDIRRGSRDPGVRVRDVSDDVLDAGLDTFLRLHAIRWRRRGLPGSFFTRQRRAFLREWSEQAARNGWLRLSVVEWQGAPCAALYAMATGNTCYYYQSGLNARVEGISPGTIAVAHAIRTSIDSGQTRFDFMRGDEPYKRRWKPAQQTTNVRWLAPANRLLGPVTAFGAGVALLLEGRLRGRLEGRGLP